MNLSEIKNEMEKLAPAQRAKMRRFVSTLFEGDTLTVEQIGWKTRVRVFIARDQIRQTVELGPKGAVLSREVR